jgi:hypothetical protein
MLGCGLDVVSEKHPRLFMGMVHHRTTKGDRMKFRDKPWLTAIYKDQSHEMVIVKCSQVHMTEHALCAMYTFANQGKRGMYVLPSKEHRKTFVQDRINHMRDFSPLYENAIKTISNESDSNVYKSIFGKGWKFVGSNVRKDFFEFPCEVLFFDEYDQLDQANLWYAYDRVEDVANPIIWKFGNPTIDGKGIHKEFMASDQKEWHVECEHCGKEQILDWYEHFVEPYHNSWKLRHPAGLAVCSECDRSFDRMGYGRWIAMNPGKNRASGYRITRLFVDKKKKPSDMIHLFRKFMSAQNDPTALQNFHNNYLGMTYENIEFKLTETILKRSVFPDMDKFDFDVQACRTIMGVDQGKKFTCVISMVWDGEIIDLHYTNVDRWTDVEALEDRWNVICTVIDAQGGGYADTRDFVMAKGNRWMCYYRPKDQIKGNKAYKLNYKDRIVDTNRTEMLDLMVKGILDKKIHAKHDFQSSEGGSFMKQMLVPSRITNTAGRPVWTKGVDHFFHSSGYRYLAKLVSGVNNSIAGDVSWRAGSTNLARNHGEPKARVIGQIQEKPNNGRPRRSWHL